VAVMTSYNGVAKIPLNGRQKGHKNQLQHLGR